MRGLKARIDNLYQGSISHVSSRIVVLKDDKVIKKVVHGNNKQKVIELVIKF